MPDTDPEVMAVKYANGASRLVPVGGGLTMHVRDEGSADGPVLVLLHGSNSSLQDWEPWVERLGHKYRIISLDQIGHGLTGPNPADRYDAAAFVETLDHLVSRLGISRFALAGNSMGGLVAWEYALAHPDKLTHLILVDAAGAPEDPDKRLPIGFRLARTPVLGNLVRVITPRILFERSMRQSVTNQAVVTPLAIDRYWELNRYPGNRRASLLRFAQYSRHDADPRRLGAIKVPTLIMWGEDDKLIPVSGADWFARAIPHSRKVIYPGIGHAPMMETPDRSAAEVDLFLSSPFPSGPALPSIAPKP